MLNRLQTVVEKISLKQIIVIGLIFRFAAVIFSKGYAFHDDHFEMAELVQRWKEGISFLWTGSDVHVFSLVYPGFLYIIFEACHAVGLHSPEQILFVIRLIHALISLLSIYYSYKIAIALTANKLVANVVAMLFAVFWLFPFMAVRNLREFFCVHFLMIATYYFIAFKFSVKSLIISSLFFAVAFSIRLQIIFIPAAMGFVLLCNKLHFKKGLIFGIGCLISFMLTQGLFDFVYYGNPIASIMEYIRFNADPANIAIQPQGPWFQYIGTVAGVVFGIPFIVLAIGYLYSFKLTMNIKILFWGSLLFFIFHSYYSNKQERFILPFIPYFLILGVVGFHAFYEKFKKQQWTRVALKITVVWFLVFNTIGLCVLTFTYTKRSRVEAMVFLREQGDVQNIIMESLEGAPRPPLFYLGKQIKFLELQLKDSLPEMKHSLTNVPNTIPNYIIMSGDKQMEKRLTRLKKMYPTLQFVKDIKPSLVDNIAYLLNPKHNENEVWHVYSIGGKR